MTEHQSGSSADSSGPLQVQRNFVKIIADSANPALVLDTRGIILAVNAAFELRFGFQELHLIGRPFDCLFAAGGSEAVQSASNGFVPIATQNTTRFKTARRTAVEAEIVHLPQYARDGKLLADLILLRELPALSQMSRFLHQFADMLQHDGADITTTVAAGLEAATLYLGLDQGLLVRCEAATVSVVDSIGLKQSSDVITEDDPFFMYCRLIMNDLAPIALHDISVSRFAPARKPASREPYAFFGIPVIVNGEPDGALLFAGSKARDMPFTTHDVAVIRLLAAWVGQIVGDGIGRVATSSQPDVHAERPADPDLAVRERPRKAVPGKVTRRQ